MNTLVLCTVLLMGVITANAFPYNNYGRLRRAPYQNRGMMVAGYYGNPYRRSAYMPESGMTAFVSGETLATNQYDQQAPLALDFENEDQEVPLEDQTEGVRPEQQTEHDVEVPTSKPKRLPKRKPQKPQPEEDDEEDEDEGFNPFAGKAGRGHSNVFFPIVFRGNSGARTRNSEEGGYPGSATAVANSFSTGKGGVASSHATAYGDPYSAMFFRNANGKRKAQQHE